MKQKNNSKLARFGFTRGHYAMIGFFVVALAGLTFTQEPLLLENLFGLKFLRAEQEQVAQEVAVPAVEEVDYEAIDAAAAEKDQMLSLLDPFYKDGSVLGANTEGKQMVDDILSEENLSTIPVKTVADSESRFEKYSEQVNLIESYNGSIIILGSLSEQNPASALKTIPMIKSTIGELKDLEVPQSFTRLHRLRMMQYAVLLSMANNIASNSSPEDKGAAAIVYFEILDAMEVENSALIKKFSYGL